MLLLGTWSNTASAQGAMNNGWTHEGTISPVGDSDSWTFSANAGDSIVIRVGEITTLSGAFTPRIRLNNPTGGQQATASSAVASEIVVMATNTGTFTVIVDVAAGTATGTYRLTLAKSPGAIIVAPGDEGGPLTNGVDYIGNFLPPGDLDVWTFNALAGESIVLKAGQMTDTNNFDPWIRVYGPTGILLGSVTDVAAAEVALRATNSGDFTVLIANYPYYSDAANGTYRLTLAKTSDPMVVSPGDEGGPLTNAVAHQGNLPLGDLDLWNFSASAGDSLVLKMGQITDTNNFDPWIRLYGPDGALLSSVSAFAAAEVTLRATNSGTFQVVVGNNPYYSDAASGLYLLTLAKTGDAIVVSPGDEGGPLTNGVLHQGSLPLGDLDLWNFSANAGQTVVLRLGQITDVGNFDPWIRLYGPNGALLASDFSFYVGEVTIRATNSGTFLVVVGNNPYNSDAASGTYLLTLAKTGDPIVVSAGDDGGPLTNGIAHQGDIPIGDLDLWNFTASAGQSIVVRMGQITDTNSFDPWVRLYGPDGALLLSDFGAAVSEVTLRATNSGTFLVVTGNNDYNNNAGSGTYVLTLAKTGEPALAVDGDQGGAFGGSGNYNGTIALGDLDVWTFTTCAGEWIDIRADEIVQTNSFAPWVRLYGPNGVLIGSSFGAAFGQVARSATNSGNHTVVIGNNDYYNNAGSGTYALTVNGLRDDFRLCNPTFSGTNANVGAVGGEPGATFILFTQTNVATPLVSWTPILTNQFDQYGVFIRSNVSGRYEPQRYFFLFQQ